MNNIIKMIRPKHWIKNIFIFAPIVFSLNFTKLIYLQKSLIVFISFCLIASAVYVINDLVDKNSDRNHPIKKNRPIASGKVKPSFAIFIFVLLFLSSILISQVIGNILLVIILIYFFINILYSLFLKNLVILDVFFLAFGFLLRIYAGGLSLNIPISHWVILTTFFLSLFLGFGKRRTEYMLEENVKKQTRKTINDYNKDILDYFLITSMTLTIITYGLYTISPVTIKNFGNDNLIYTLPVVVFGLFRYTFLLFKNKTEDVVEIVTKDKFIIITCLVWFLLVITILYFNSNVVGLIK
jgi:decaprenyl-phosphate phosphoribosyltransferase